MPAEPELVTCQTEFGNLGALLLAVHMVNHPRPLIADIAAWRQLKSSGAQERLTALKNSGKLTPVGELVETQKGETGKKSMMEVKK